MAPLEFWYDFASTYSYLSAMRIAEKADGAGVEVHWRPFLLGPILAAQGWTTSPFNIYPAKGKNMWRDMERQCEIMGLPLVRPDPFPANSLLAARVALVVDDIPAFTRGVYHAAFGQGRPISEREAIGSVLSTLGMDADRVLDEALSDNNKARLKMQTAKAAEIGIYGAPSYITADGELFWGNDRLEQALDWASSHDPARQAV